MESPCQSIGIRIQYERTPIPTYPTHPSFQESHSLLIPGTVLPRRSQIQDTPPTLPVQDTGYFSPVEMLLGPRPPISASPPTLGCYTTGFRSVSYGKPVTTASPVRQHCAPADESDPGGFRLSIGSLTADPLLYRSLRLVASYCISLSNLREPRYSTTLRFVGTSSMKARKCRTVQALPFR